MFVNMQSTSNRPLKIQHRQRNSSKNSFSYEKPSTKLGLSLTLRSQRRVEHKKPTADVEAEPAAESADTMIDPLIYKTGCYQNICVIAVSYTRSVGCWSPRREQARENF